jgi:hypothetical protein
MRVNNERDTFLALFQKFHFPFECFSFRVGCVPRDGNQENNPFR